ncbi:MAG: hypothetical protein ACREQV_23000 [Candidatus Binatia bacterium]
MIRSLAQIGKFNETLAHGEEAIQIATERDYPLSIVFAYNAVGVVALLKGEFSEAIVALERSLSVCEAAEIPVQRPLVVSCLSSAYAYVGRFDEALRLLESTTDREAWMSTERSRQLPFGKAMRMVWEVEALMLADRRSDAEALARRVLEVSEASKDKGSEGWLRCQLADLMTWREPKHAEASYTQAINLAQKLSMCPLQARCHLGLGRLYAESSNSDMARSELYASIELYRAMSMPFWIAKAERALDSLS